MLQPVLRELFKDEEQERHRDVLADLQQEVSKLRSNEIVQRETENLHKTLLKRLNSIQDMLHVKRVEKQIDDFRETILKRLDGIHDMIHTQRTEIQEQRLLLLRILECHQRVLQQINEPTGQMIVDLEEAY